MVQAAASRYMEENYNEKTVYYMSYDDINRRTNQLCHDIQITGGK